jgi:hypothetical protein
VRSAALLLQRGQAFQDAAQEALRAEPGRAHATV